MRKSKLLALFSLSLLILASAFSTGCKRHQKPNIAATIEDQEELSSIVHMADPAAASQLLRGFHPVEQNAWRWSMQKFAVSLRAPAKAQVNGAMLELRFAIPDVVIEKLKELTLSATLNGLAIEPVKYDKPGDQVYSREVPASALKGEAVTVEFSLDKVLPAGSVDQRELGVVVTSVSLESK